MKKTLLFIFAVLFAGMALNAKDIKSIRVYLNPGHGSWGPEDRPMATIPYPATMETGRPDTCGFYESNTNLWKTLGLAQKLVENGFSRNNIVESRITNGPYPYVSGAPNADVCNRNLSEICEEVEAGNFDMFLSVHSNAAADGAIANYPLFLFRGYDNGSTSAPGSTAMCSTMWPYLMSNGIDYYTSYSPTNPNIRGDIDFYGSSSAGTRADGKSYTGYLGVLKHGVPGLLSEGYFHTYQPARHRALNRDYCIQEGIRYMRGILAYFGLPAEKIGYIMGTVKDSKNQINHPLFQYAPGSNDQWYPINGATVTLYKDGKQVDVYHVDNNYNGVFVFSNLEPGNYTLDCTAPNYSPLSSTYKTAIKVTANATSYSKIFLTPVTGYTPPTPSSTPIETTDHTYYAYNLTSSVGTDNITFSFSSTGDAKSANLLLTEKATQKVSTFPINNVKAGSNSLSINTSGFAPGDYNWAIQIESNPVDKTRAFFRFSNSGTGSGVAINTYPFNRYFGQIYFSDGYSNMGIFALNPDLKVINTSPLFSSEFVGSATSPGRLAINPYSGYVFIADWIDSHSGIFYFTPYLRTQLYSFFNGTRESSGRIVSNAVAIGGSTSGLTFSGAGTDTKLFAFEEDYPTANGNQLCRYDISTGSTWSKAPSASYSNVSSLMLNHNVNLVGDDNGVWLSQIRGSGHNTSDVPALVYMNNNGNILFNSGRSLTSLSGCNGGGIAINVDKTLMAITNGEGGIEIYKLSWNNGVPSLARQYTIDNSDGAVAQMAFDYAGNLYVSARYGNKAYVLQNPDPIVSTPGKTILTIADGINHIETDQTTSGISLSSDKQTLIIQCTPQVHTANLFSATGILIKEIALTEGKANVNIQNLQQGIYIVRAANKSFSFVRAHE